MTLLLNNDDIQKVLTMDMTIKALEQAYRDLAAEDAVCRPRIDIRIPTGADNRLYQWGTMEGGSATSGYFAIRAKSDVVYEQEYNGVRTQEKYCVRPGLFCGLILLFSTRNGEPLAIINDGVLQHLRVGADSAIGVRYAAREDARVLGMVGSGGMARSHLESIGKVRDIRRLQVWSPTPEHRRQYAEEMAERYGIEAVAVDDPRDVYRGADIICGCTDASGEVIVGDWLEPGTHVTCIGGRPDARTKERTDVWLRLGNATASVNFPEQRPTDETVAYLAQPGHPAYGMHRMGQRPWRAPAAGAGKPRLVSLEDLLMGRAPGRTAPEEITYSERGNIQGAQFFAVAGAAYEEARRRGIGRELPTEWFLQDIRD
jgi:ornithine cyclodeaminase/alanine dehydrogenase-like protein (mu-crystallin family)